MVSRVIGVCINDTAAVPTSHFDRAAITRACGTRDNIRGLVVVVVVVVVRIIGGAFV